MSESQPTAGSGSSSFCNLQAERDPESNFSLDICRLLEDYLIKICTGQATDIDNVNFAEAALLVQGSVQVYSRKVEYLHSLVLHVLEFISNQGRHQSQAADESGPEDRAESSSSRVPLEDEDSFWVGNDVPVDPKNLLDSSADESTPLQKFVIPPANLVVLEGDCLDTSDAVGELESYLLASNELYRDFILLDRCDVESVNAFSATNKVGDGVFNAWSNHKSFLSPRSRSGAGGSKVSAGKNCSNLKQSSHAGRSFGVDDAGTDHPNYDDGFDNCEFDNVSTAEHESRDDDDGDSDEGDDPWKPLNPHEPGTLKVKPFKRVKGLQRARKDLLKKISIANMFPLAKRHGTICQEFKNIWEKQHLPDKKKNQTISPPLFEKLRQSLIDGSRATCNSFGSFEENGDDYGDHDIAEPDTGMTEDTYNNRVEEDERQDWHDDAACVDDGQLENLTSDPPVSLEDLCHSHLDALLTNITGSEMQSGLASRVSNWKQKIEQNLEEQDSLPPFQIHEYGERVLDKLSHDEEPGTSLSFTDIVRGQAKHDVARTFSALLQLVNNEDVHLVRSDGGNTLCYTAANSFSVGLKDHGRREARIKLPSPKKRAKAPLGRSPKAGRNKHRRHASPESLSESRSSRSLSKLGMVGCSREGKRRRNSGQIRPANEAVSNS